ncbi:hypothetical protein JOB18_019166 [Solea senegalensis]|uniref:Uncharacterized protein n=1 Tax=Solea senegalensis TaxID=28829 RepID=A0AAV6QI33_SOLSE|nr:hypothetical protein JOB18_019166 [Solea senegalensis]
MKMTKTTHRIRLTDEHLRSIMKVASAQSLNSNINELASKKRCQESVTSRQASLPVYAPGLSSFHREERRAHRLSRERRTRFSRVDRRFSRHFSFIPLSWLSLHWNFILLWF